MRIFNRRNLIVLLLLTGVVIGLVLWRELGESPPSARVARAEVGNLVQTFRTNGVVEPVRFREVRAQYPDRVVNVRVREGDRVRAGESLGSLDGREARAAVAQAKSDLYEARQALAKVQGRSSLRGLDAQISEAKVDLSLAQTNLKRDRRLLSEKAISMLDFEETQAAYQKTRSHLNALKSERRETADHLQPLEEQGAEARVSQAQAALQAAESRLRETRVPAPMSGTVLVKPPDPGTLVSVGDLLAKIGDLSQLRVRAYIDQPDFSEIHLGSIVQIASTGFPGETWQGRVKWISAELSTVGKRIVGQALCSVEDGRDPLPINSNVDLTFTSREMKGVLLIPVDAVYQTDSHNSVYLVKSDRLYQQTVEVGASNADSIVILKGLAKGEIVLDDLEVQPKEGMHVSPRRQGQ
jgi:HlyD family secretion protein